MASDEIVRRTLVVVAGFLLFVSPGATGLVAGSAAIGQAESQESAEPPAAAASSTPRPDTDEIIRRFAAKEKEFKIARDNYTYRQIVKVDELNDDGNVVGTYQLNADIIFTPQGRRTEKVVFAPISTLRGFGMTPEDERDLRSIQPFVLTTDELPKYNIQYQGRQKVDELDTYVFKVAPKRLEKGERYFEGMVWVDQEDYQIVKTYGKAVPDIRQGKQENLFPRFETYRERIDGKYWFPTWTGAEDTLYFSSGPKKIRMLVRYENYKQFKSETKITFGDEVDTPPQIQ